MGGGRGLNPGGRGSRTPTPRPTPTPCPPPTCLVNVLSLVTVALASTSVLSAQSASARSSADLHFICGVCLFLTTDLISCHRAAFITCNLKQPACCLIWYAPVILSRFGRYVVPTLLTSTFGRNWCWFRLSATLCHDVLRCCLAIATPEPRYCPVLTRLTSDTGKFSCVVLRYVSLSPRCSLAVATLYYTVSRIWRSIACHNVSET